MSARKLTLDLAATGVSGVRHPNLWLARRATSVGAHVMSERLRPRTVRTADDVPGAASEITEDWLGAVLCRDVSGAAVTGFSMPGGSSGTSERIALRVTYNDAGTQAGLPTELFMKMTASFSQRLLLGSVDVINGETNFFMRFRPRVDMEAPLGHWGRADDHTWKSVVVMEDIAATKGATFSEPVTPLTRSDVEDLLDTMARYHGAFWADPQLGILKSPVDHFNNVGRFISMRKRCVMGMRRAKEVIPPSLYGQADRLWEGTRRGLEANAMMPRTLLHGDSHVGQTYRTADGRMGLADWQATLQGGWAYDFAYLVGSACEPADRRAWDRELLEMYLGRLAEEGGRPPAFEDAWRSYCQCLFYPYSAWAFTIGRAAYQPKMQPDEFSLAIIRRLTAAIDENEAFSAVGL